jgi:hypothetical protein
MEVRLDTEIISIPRMANFPSKPSSPAARAQEVSFAQTDAINGALAQTPAVRPEEVQRAKTLLSSEHYPPQVMMEKISRLLAVMSGKSQSE